MSFLTISNENIFSKTQGTRLGAIVASNNGQEKALDALSIRTVPITPDLSKVLPVFQ